MADESTNQADMEDKLLSLCAMDFEPHVGSGFGILSTALATEAELTLEEVTPHPQYGLQDLREPFSLLFSGSISELHSAGNYKLSHRAMESVQLFLSPVTVHISNTSQRELQYYEAVFS